MCTAVVQVAVTRATAQVLAVGMDRITDETCPRSWFAGATACSVRGSWAVGLSSCVCLVCPAPAPDPRLRKPPVLRSLRLNFQWMQKSPSFLIGIRATFQSWKESP